MPVIKFPKKKSIPRTPITFNRHHKGMLSAAEKRKKSSPKDRMAFAKKFM